MFLFVVLFYWLAFIEGLRSINIILYKYILYKYYILIICSINLKYICLHGILYKRVIKSIKFELENKIKVRCQPLKKTNLAIGEANTRLRLQNLQSPYTE